MKETIRFSCGCEGVVDICGKKWERERTRYRYENYELCPECKEKERQKRNEESAARAEKLGLPQLSGSEKQIAWANTIRDRFLDMVKAMQKEPGVNEESRKVVLYLQTSLLESGEAKDFKKHYPDYIAILTDLLDRVVCNLITSKTSASFWIDHRTRDDFIIMIKNAMLESYRNYEYLEESVEAEQETVVSPENPVYDGYVRIRAGEDEIKAIYEKNDSFIDIVKSLHFTWTGSYWSKIPTKRKGRYEDLTAELGNKLLLAGFSVSITDSAIREKAVSGNYEPECRRWIDTCDKENFLVFHFDKDDTLKSELYRIPGVIWIRDSKGYGVNVTYYKEALDYADIYHFKTMPDAQKMIAQYQQTMSNSLTVTPQTPASVPNKLQDILNSPDDIVPDLMEEE